MQADRLSDARAEGAGQVAGADVLVASVDAEVGGVFADLLHHVADIVQ